MAIFHLTTKAVSRGKGQSVLAAAAYRSGQELTDHQTGEVKRYEARKERIQFEGVFAPANAPEWARDREQLWNRVEQFESRKNSRLAREIEIALPHELTDQQREWLVKDFVREQFTRKGFAVDVAIHAPDKDSDARNFHAHLLITTRRIGADGFEEKERGHNSKEQLKEWREEWAHLCNRHLERHGHEARIDHRSHADRGLIEEPTIHVGYAAKQMEARGAQSDRMDQLRGIIDRNDAIRLAPSIELEIPDAPVEAGEKAPKRDLVDGAADATLSVIGKLADVMDDLLGGGPAPPPSREERIAERAARLAGAEEAHEADRQAAHTAAVNEAEERERRIAERLKQMQGRDTGLDYTKGRERDRY